MFDLNKGLKLKELYVEKYKVLKDFKIDFMDRDNNPLPIVVIAGVNGTGKTTMLDTIISPKLFNQNQGALGYLDTPLEEQEEKKFEIKILFHGKEDIFNRELNSSHINTYNSVPSEEDKKLFEIEKYISYFYIGFNNLSTLENIIIDYIDSLIYEKYIPANKVYATLKEYINQVFLDMNLMIEFHSLDKNKKVFICNKQGEIFSLDKISTGEKTLFTKILSLYLSKIKDSVILIDEPELSLHPRWQNQVLKLYEKFANENNCQIIIATHSPHIIGSAKNEYIRLLTEDGVINDVLAYGRDIEWVLEEVMGASYTREATIAKKIEECQELLNDEKFDEAEKCIDNLENIIGSNDSEVLKLRNDLFFERTDYEEDN